MSKLLFRKENATLDNDKRVNKLHDRVKKILTSMPLESIQKCSRRAREYKLSYLQLLTDKDKELRMTEIEKVKKEIKGKRCSLDQDFTIIKDMVESMITVDDYVVKKEEVIHKEFCVVKIVKEKKDTFKS